MDNTAYDDEEEEVHSFADDEDLEVKFSIDEAEIQVPGPVETGANSRFLSSDLSASRSPRFSNPTMERQNSFKYRRSNRVAENYRAQEAPEVKVAMDPRQAHQSSYDEVETRVRSAPSAVSLKKSGSPSTPKYSPRSSNRTTPVLGPQQTLHQTPKPTPQVTRASHHANDSPAANGARPEDSPGPVASPAPAPVASSASKKTTHHVPTRSPQPAPSRSSVTKRPVVEPSSANKRHSGIPTPQRPAFGSLAAKSPAPAPAVTPTPAAVVHKTVKPTSTAKQPTTELLSPIRARNFEEALKSSISRSSTPTSLHRPRYSIDNLAIHAPTTPTITGKEWNGSVRVKKPSANLEAQEHLDLLKRDSGEKALSRSVRRQPGSGEGLTAQNLDSHRQSGENNSAFSHSSYHTGTPSSLFSPVSQRKYGEDNTNGQRSVSSRSNTPSSLRPSSRPSSRPTSRSTTPTNASAARRAPRDASLGQYFNTDEMTEISGYDSQAGDRLHRGNATPASGSLLSPYNLMVESTHDRALDSALLSDADLQSVAKQMLLLRLMLQAKNAADAEKEEADILHAWQVVHSVEEQAQLMASQDSGIDEVSRTHQHILDMEKMVDELNDHLAPVFERLSAYRTLKEAQNATSNTGEASDGSVTSLQTDPLLDAYSERAQAHKELQTRLASLVKSIAALKKTVDSESFVCPSEEALVAKSMAERENAEGEEDSPNVASGYRVIPAVNPVRVPAGAPVADRSRSTSPAPTRRLSLVERQTLNREAMVAKNAQQREAEAASVAPPAHTVVPARSKSPAAAARGGGTTVFSVPAAARPTAASIAGVVRPKSPGPATAAAARSKSPAPVARAKSPGPAGAGAAKRLNRPPAAGVSAVLENTVSDGKQPRSVPRAKKAEPTVEPTPEMSVAAAAETVESIEDNSVDEAVLQENVARPELTTQEHTAAADEATVTEEDVVSHRAASEEGAAAPVAASETNNSVEDQGTSEILPAVEDSASAAASAIPATAELAPIVWKEEEVDAQLNSMFVVPLASPNSVNGVNNAVLPTPPLSPMTPGPSNTDAFNPALISAAAGTASSAESTADVASEGASPSKKAAFERLMKRLNSNKEMNSANDSGNNSNRVSPVVPAVAEVSEVPAVAASAAVNGTAAADAAGTGASASVSVAVEEPLTRRLSVAEMRAQFSGGAAKQPLAKQSLAPRPAAVPVIVAPAAVVVVAAPAVDPVVAAEVVPAMTPEIVDVLTPVVAPVAAVSTAPIKAAEGEAFNSNNKDLTLDIMSAEAVTVEFNDNSPISQKDGESNSATSATTSPFKSGEVKVPVLAGLAGPTTPSGVSPMKRVQSTRVSELMNKFGGSRRDLTPASSPSPAAAPSPAPAITRNASVRGSIASISGIEVKRSVFEKGELNIADGEAAEITATKSPGSLSKQRSKSPASLSRPGSSNNLSPVAGKSPSSTSNGMRAGSKSPARSPNVGSKSPAAAVGGASNSNPASPANWPATSLKSVPSFTGGASSKSAAAAVFTFAEKEDEEQKALVADTSAVVAESAAESIKESVPVPAPIATEMAPPSYEESSIDAASLADTYIALNNASASASAVRVEAGAATPLSGRSPRTPGTARTVTLASPEQLPMTKPFATSPNTVELLQAAASTESDGSMDWGVDGTYSHSLQVSRSEEFIRTANTNASQLKMQTVTEEGAGENGVVDEKEEDLTATVVSAVSAKLTAHFQATKSSENVLAAMEAERDEDVQQVEAVASTGNGNGEEEEEGLVLDLNTIETSIKHSPKPHNAPTGNNHVKSADPSTVDATQPLATSASTAAPAAAVTTTATVSEDSQTNSPANGEGAYSRVQSGRFSAVDSDVSMSAPPTPLPLTSFTNVTSSVKAQNTPVVAAAAETPQPDEESAQEAEAEAAEGEADGDFAEGDFGADGNSETASLAGSTATNGSKKHRRPTLKGLWKRIGSVSSMSGSSKQKPGTEL